MSGQTIDSSALLDATERQRLKQMEINCRWLMDITDRIHDALCPGQCGTWQDRAKQAVEAAERLASNNRIRLRDAGTRQTADREEAV